MAQQMINLGTIANDGTGDTLRDGGDKINDNFTELYAGLTGLLDFKGSTDCSANPNYPVASKGDFYLVSVAGKIGGASGIDVEQGDSYFATADNAGGTQAAVGTSWTVVQGNITSYMPKSGGTFTGDIVVPAEAYGVGWNASNEAPTKNDVYDKIESLAGGVPVNLDNLADVNAPTPSNGDVLTFNSGGGTWDPQAPTGGGSVTSWKTVVRVATTVAGTLASSFENGDTIDGVALATGDRILIKNQASGAENGIYTVNASGAPTRSTDADAGTEMLGATIPISEGTLNASRVYRCTNTGTITLGTTALTFSITGNNERALTRPMVADFTLQNAGTATITDGTYGMALTVPTATTNIRFARKNGSPPATPYSVIVKARPIAGYSATTIYKMCLIARNSSNGRIIIYGMEYNNGQHLVQRWTNYTTFSANGLAPVNLWAGHELPWMKMTNDGTNLTFHRSSNGTDWYQYHSEPLATYLTASGGTCDEIGVGSFMASLGFTDSCLFESFEVV